jgi:P4 family phage/plasmid primase-like protien
MDSNLDSKNLNDFLNEHRITGKNEFNYTGVGKFLGKYHIKEEEKDEFFKILSEEIFDNNQEVSLIERHNKIGPILIDLDLRYNEKEKGSQEPAFGQDIDIFSLRTYTFEHIKEFVGYYFTEINKYFMIPNDERNDILQAFVFERPKPYQDKDCIKDGIHIMFPFIQCEPTIRYIIRDNVLKNLNDFFQKINCTNPAFKILDRSIIEQNGWYLYGCRKPGRDAYKLTYILDEFGNELDKTIYCEKQLTQLLSIQNDYEKTELNEDFMEQIITYKQVQHTVSKKKIAHNTLTDNEMQDIVNLVELLSVDRADTYDDWMSVGWCLYNICPTDERLFFVWEEFSRKSHKFEEGECEKKWKTFEEKNFTILSLHFWARTDNPAGYMDFTRRNIRDLLEMSLTATTVDVAKVLYQMYKYDYVCASIKEKIWYEFIGHRWVECEEGETLRKKISNELVFEYCKIIESCNQKINEIESVEENGGEGNKGSSKFYQRKASAYTELTQKLKTTSFIDNIMKEARYLFYDKEFLNKLDENKYLLGFENGIYDLNTHNFRDGKPDDYVSLSTKINYIPYVHEDELVEQIFDFLSKVFPIMAVREFVITLMSSFLQGHNADEFFNIWTGTGGNGKSKLNELFVSGLGQYATKFPITLLTGKRGQSNAASPELAESKGRRYGYFEEPDEGERINVGLMKELTGGDKVKARALFKNFFEFKPQFKLVLLCNDLPKVPPDDEGTWRRMKVVEFISKFVDNPKNEFEFKKDKYLSEKLIIWKETFMSILIEYHKIYREKGIEVPLEITKYTEEYKKTMDVYIDFINERLKKTDNKNDHIQLDDAHEEFKDWYINNFNTAKYPTKRDLKNYLEKKIGKKYVNQQYITGFVRVNMSLKNYEEFPSQN